MLFKNNLNNLFQSNLCSIFAHIKFLKELGMRLSELKTGEKACSKPCPACSRLIKNLGIKNVYYIDEDGDFVKERYI